VVFILRNIPDLRTASLCLRDSFRASRLAHISKKGERVREKELLNNTKEVQISQPDKLQLLIKNERKSVMVTLSSPRTSLNFHGPYNAVIFSSE
jgi:hypothetical protein